MRLLQSILSLIYRSIFVASDSGYRLAHLLSKVAFIASLALYIARTPDKAYAFAIVMVLGLVHPGVDWVLSALKLSLLAGTVAVLIALLASLVGVYTVHPLQVLGVIANTANVVSATLFSLSIISPTEIYNAVLKLGGKRVATVALLSWVLVAQYLKQLQESLGLSNLKAKYRAKTSPSKIASRLLEVSRFFEEYRYWRIRAPAEMSMSFDRSYKYTAVLLIATLLVTFLGYL